MTDVRKERIPLLCGRVKERILAKGFSFNKGVRSDRVSAEERRCLEGVYTVRKSER